MSKKNDFTIDRKNRRTAILQIQYTLFHYVEGIEDEKLKEQARNIIDNLFIYIIRDDSKTVEPKRLMQMVVSSEDDVFNSSIEQLK